MKRGGGGNQRSFRRLEGGKGSEESTRFRLESEELSKETMSLSRLIIIFFSKSRGCSIDGMYGFKPVERSEELTKRC
jgi:hypothetical protein